VVNCGCGPLYPSQVRQRTGVPLILGGQVTDRVLRLWEFLGAQTHAARIERNARDRPLGGYVAHQRTVVMSVSFPVSTIVVLLLSPRSFCRLR